MTTHKKSVSKQLFSSKQTHDIHGSGVKCTMRFQPAPADMSVVVLTCASYRLDVLVEEYAVSAGRNAARFASHACTAHGIKHFAGNLPALYLRTHSLNQKCALLTLSEMGQAKT